MKKVCLIKQSGGLGDLLYLTKIAIVHQQRGYRVIWPVEKSLLHCNEYIKDVDFVDVEGDFEHKEIYNSGGIMPYEEKTIKYIPTLIATDSTKCQNWEIMRSKYVVAGMDDCDWASYLNINRDLCKENELKNLLRIDYGEPYCLVNRNYQPWKGDWEVYKDIGFWPAEEDKVGRFRVDSKIRRIDMIRIDGFTIFDWIGIMEHCKEIWTMDTCNTLLMEVINTDDIEKKIMFCRHKKVRVINYLYKKNWDIKLLRYYE